MIQMFKLVLKKIYNKTSPLACPKDEKTRKDTRKAVHCKNLKTPHVFSSLSHSLSHTHTLSLALTLSHSLSLSLSLSLCLSHSLSFLSFARMSHTSRHRTRYFIITRLQNDLTSRFSNLILKCCLLNFMFAHFRMCAVTKTTVKNDF